MTVTEGELLWTPSEKRAEDSQLAQFARWVSERSGYAFSNYEDLWSWSVTSIDDFWRCVWEYCEVMSDEAPHQVRSGDEMFRCKWFEGTHVNYAEHLLRHELRASAQEVAFYHCGEGRPVATLTWHQLGGHVRALASSLRDMGVEPGDRIVSYLPNIVEAAIAMIATTAIGAVWSAASPEFGPTTVLDRFTQINPKILLATDGYTFGGRRIDRRAELRSIVEGLPSLASIIWVNYLGHDMPLGMAPKAFLWDDLLSRQAPSPGAFTFERVPHDHPLWVLFTSGTTGLPKAIVHSHVGLVVDHLKVMRLHFDLQPGKCMFFYTTTGWMMWNAVCSALITGASAVLYEGSPSFPEIDSLWDIVEATGTTTFGASPKLVQMMDKEKIVPSISRTLDRLDTIILGGAPCTPDTFEWLYTNVKKDLAVFSTSGGTDLCGSLVGPVPTAPVYAGEIQGRVLGIAVHSWDDNGTDVTDAVGELVITKPFPSMPIGFWGDEDDARYRDTYFNHFPGVWRHGDLLKINSRGGCFIYGRSDATLNRFGVRIGSAEIYRAIGQMQEIEDSLVVCCETPGGEYFMPLFLHLKPEHEFTEDLKQRVLVQIRNNASPRHVPDIVVAAPAIPYTLTGKRMEVPVRKILMGLSPDTVVSAGAMANPAAILWFAEFAARADTRSWMRGNMITDRFKEKSAGSQSHRDF